MRRPSESLYLYAVFSLLAGLALTQHQLTVGRAWGLLWAISVNGRSHEFGPLFWTMHSTFLPTAVYLSFVLVAWLAKCVVLPLQLLLEKGERRRDPFKRTGDLCILLAALIAISQVFLIR